MKALLLGVAVVVAAVLAITLFGSRTVPEPVARAGVTAGGITLTSASIEEPEDASRFAGPQADLLTARCTACHSPSMPLRQPRFDLAKWTAEVEKMRDVYGATVPPEEVAPIAQALVDLQAAPAT